MAISAHVTMVAARSDWLRNRISLARAQRNKHLDKV